MRTSLVLLRPLWQPSNHRQTRVGITRTCTALLSSGIEPTAVASPKSEPWQFLLRQHILQNKTPWCCTCTKNSKLIFHQHRCLRWIQFRKCCTAYRLINWFIIKLYLILLRIVIQLWCNQIFINAVKYNQAKGTFVFVPFFR